MKAKLFVVVVVMTAIIAGASAVQGQTLFPTDDVSVYTGSEGGTATVSPGVYIGNDSYGGIARLYEKFVLPAYVPGSVVTGASFDFQYLWPYNNGSYNGTGALQVFATSTAWDANTITWFNKPDGIATALQSIDMNGLPYTPMTIDLTGLVSDAYKNGGVVSFLIMSPQEGSTNNDWRYIYSADNAKSLIVTIAAVPEPETSAMMLAGLGLLGFVARRRKHNQACA